LEQWAHNFLFQSQSGRGLGLNLFFFNRMALEKGATGSCVFSQDQFLLSTGT
jgi:hypothetical protein